ncbi:THUMP domain [Micractinium conductrix]|uniref:THUMP domain n=1 Tax=Micractinium conductrix TaxID=554055 RepID=A0A2P6V949_9CHLO|nr:THUMP domain [Micractinium conductrix]|eukprot:PSC70613.1 THUMP domain [Micractinium conductrix]
MSGQGNGASVPGTSAQAPQPPVVMLPDGRLQQPAKLGAVVSDALRRWYLETEKEALRGDVKAQALLGQMLIEGYGCEADPAKGREWAEKARRRGYRMDGRDGGRTMATATKHGSEFILQTTNQSLATRLWRYALGDTLFYPPGIGQAEQVGPYTGSTGPCLVRFRDSQLTTAQLNSWILSGCSSSAAIVRVYWLGGSPGTATSREDLLTQLAAAGAPPGPVRLQVFPRRHEAALVDALPAGWQLQPVGPEWVLNVLQLSGVEGEAGAAGQPAAAPPERQRQAAAAADPQQPAEQQQQQQPAFLWSLQRADDLYNYSPDRTKRIPDQLCKAAAKLEEALLAAGLAATQGVAIDLGAAPGGWTHVLARHAQHVIAVDPAAMDPRALASGRVTHLACKAEDAVERIQELAGDSGVGLLVADVNRHPVTLPDMLRPLLPLLHPGAPIIFTLKFYGFGFTREAQWRGELAAALGEDFERVQLVWLLANTRHELTCMAVKRAAPAAGGAAAAAAEEPETAAAAAQ